jgi:hypothetical protein
MRNILFLAAITAALGIAALAEAAPAIASHGPKAAADSILKVESAFETEAETLGTAAAFRDYMDAVDGREFAGGGDPLSGQAIVAAHKDDPGKLSWTPSEVFASKAGDMGVTWGRWAYALPKAGAKPITGRYVTVWRKDAAGAWKAIIDIGNPDP